MKRILYISLILSCISLQVAAMKLAPELMVCEVSSISGDNCCSHEDKSGDRTDEDCDGVCACCVATIGINQKSVYFQYLVSLGYLEHNTLYKEDCPQIVISKLEQPPRGQFNSTAF